MSSFTSLCLCIIAAAGLIGLSAGAVAQHLAPIYTYTFNGLAAGMTIVALSKFFHYVREISED